MTKVEEVARAMFEKRPQNRAGVKWENTHPHTRRVWRQTALIGIEAMRPMGEHIQRSSTYDDEIFLGGHLDAYDFATIWGAGIDAILAEHQSTPGDA